MTYYLAIADFFLLTRNGASGQLHAMPSMNLRPALSKAEMEIARIVWDLHQATVRNVLSALPDGREIDYKTVQTFLRRLETKGYLVSNRSGRSLIYSPSVDPREVIHDTVKDFVGRLFDGNAVSLIEHLVRDHQLSQQQLQHLREVIIAVEVPPTPVPQVFET